MSSYPLPKATFANQKETLQAALRSLFSGKAEETQTDLEKLFTPTFKHYDEDGAKISNFSAWVAHVTWLRTIFKPADVNLTITQFLKDGNQVAERHISGSKDGKGGDAHSFLFYEIADDGRIEWIVETVKHRESVKDGRELITS